MVSVKKQMDLDSALQQANRDDYAESIRLAEEERKKILALFPLEGWKEMPLERYAVGQKDVEDTFCTWVEFRSPNLGSISGGSARKLIIYKHKNKAGWYFEPQYRDEHEAWVAVRAAFVKAFELAKAGKFEEIDELEPLQSGRALKLKALHIYFPDEILPVYSKDHIEKFLDLLGRGIGEVGRDVVRLNRALLAAVRNDPGFNGWSTQEIVKFFYQYFDPRSAQRIVKIAPGEDAKYWSDCLAGGYICVGWDEVGDLREFDSKADFRQRFGELFPYNGNTSAVSKKANEVWTLIELEPGDIVVANHGISKILAVGKVIEPGYEWRPERADYKHSVRIEWDTSVARQIEPQKNWATVTVAKVSPELYRKLISGSDAIEERTTRIPPDKMFTDIADALERKGQVILYGPPGTGKTYTARRFAVWWLLRDQVEDILAVLSDNNAFAKAERKLSTVQIRRRVWWIVANPKEWAWERLFIDGSVEYRYGRLQKNFTLVQPGDLVIGYQSNPDKRIVALAKVSKEFGPGKSGDQCIELTPLAKVEHGLGYEELLKDEILSVSEPIRFRNQGTLFALTESEADHLLAMLAERNQDLQDRISQEYIESGQNAGQLTFLTFHPSYAYEDFIEGFKPKDTGDGALSLCLEDGLFKRICRHAQANPTQRYIVIIDEINRANIAKVFGELITVLEKDKRGMALTLPQSKESFMIPENVYVLGTMNTADKSIKLLDAALRRRFAFAELMPDMELLHGAKIAGLELDDFLDELNKRIASTEGREKQIGHSFLLEKGRPVEEADEFARRFRQEILPLLQEYCYDDYAELAKYIGDKLVDKEGQVLNRELIENAESLIDALVEEFQGQGSSA